LLQDEEVEYVVVIKVGEVTIIGSVFETNSYDAAKKLVTDRFTLSDIEGIAEIRSARVSRLPIVVGLKNSLLKNSK
jgi:hypothetical protein